MCEYDLLFMEIQKLHTIIIILCILCSIQIVVGIALLIYKICRVWDQIVYGDVDHLGQLDNVGNK